MFRDIYSYKNRNPLPLIINIYEQKAAFPKKCIGAKQESIIVNYVNHLKSLNL